MMQALSAADAGKLAASLCAVDLVEDGMRVGLGTGSTAAWMVRCLAHRATREALRLTCVPTSTRTGTLARVLGLTVVTLEDAGRLDVTIDGADEFDPQFRLIKGGGGAHLQEKIVAAASDRMVVITDPSKEVAQLGAFPLPVEITPFGQSVTRARIEAVLADAPVARREARLRLVDGKPFVTDEGNLTVDLFLDRIDAPEALDTALLAIPGVVETGLFLGICDTIVIGHPDGRAELRRKGAAPEIRAMDLSVVASLPAG
jgi:ribose 5-phosphate isomerase A